MLRDHVVVTLLDTFSYRLFPCSSVCINFFFKKKRKGKKRKRRLPPRKLLVATRPALLSNSNVDPALLSSHRSVIRHDFHINIRTAQSCLRALIYGSSHCQRLHIQELKRWRKTLAVCRLFRAVTALFQ
jgi:hypothetical protein